MGQVVNMEGKFGCNQSGTNEYPLLLLQKKIESEDIIHLIQSDGPFILSKNFNV